MIKNSVKDIEVTGKTVLVRVDFNVPMRGKLIADDSRILAALPTLRLLRSRSAKTVICSHFGRPGGRVVQEMRLSVARTHLSHLLGTEVRDAGGPTGDKPREVILGLKNGEFAMLENLRFDPGEELNGTEFSKYLATLADVFINDAFGTAHRAHASTVGVAAHLPTAAGLLMERELLMLGKALGENNAQQPVVAIIGGAKVTDKIQILRHLSGKVDTILIGGGMIAAFCVASGHSGGAVAVTDKDLLAARGVIESGNAELILPSDVITATEFEQDSPASIKNYSSIPAEELIMDIGPNTSRTFSKIIASAKTLIWNGPMGVFEWSAFASGSKTVANAIASNRHATSVIGGGSTAQVVGSLGLSAQISHVSTGGGASLEFLEGKLLPGVVALDNA